MSAGHPVRMCAWWTERGKGRGRGVKESDGSAGGETAGDQNP